MIQAIHDLYHAGIDCGVESLQGLGVLAWVVDPANRRIEKTFALTDLGAISEWLVAEAARQRAITSDAKSPHDLLAELTNVRRKDARRVTADERRRRLDEQTTRAHRSA